MGIFKKWRPLEKEDILQLFDGTKEYDRPVKQVHWKEKKKKKRKDGAGDIGEGLNGPKRQGLLVYDRKKSGKLAEGE